MELQLFSDSETFTRKRPTITEAQKEEFYLMVAQEIIDKNWDKYKRSVEEIAKIVKNIFDENEDEFVLGKQFDDLKFKVSSNFIETIANWQELYQNIISNNVSTWIQVHNIKPKYKNGDKVKFTSDIFPYFKKDEVVEVYILLLVQAKYNVKGMSIEFEIIEEHTELIK